MGAGGGREIELKRRVADEAALERVAAAATRRGARVEPPVEQTNHFFDTAARTLRAAGLAIRLREEAGRWILTSKAGGRVDGAVHSRPELEREIDPSAARRILDGLADAIDVLAGAAGEGEPLVDELRAARGAAPLEPSGSFTNVRTRVGPLPLGGTPLFLELDRSVFPGDVRDHEIELEVPAGLEADAGRLLADLIAEAGVETFDAPSKAARMTRALERLAGDAEPRA